MAEIVAQHLSVAKTIISFDLHTGAGAWGHPMLLSIAEQHYAAHEWGKDIYGEWLTLLYTGAGRDSATGITATATAYLSQYLLTSLAGWRPRQCRGPEDQSKPCRRILALRCRLAGVSGFPHAANL